MEPKRSIESIGDTVQDAIDKGLKELGASPNEVIIEVLDEPSRGVFGIGARPAKVRLQLIFVRPAPSAPPAPAPEKKPAAPAPSAPRETRERDGGRGRDRDTGRGHDRDRRPQRPARAVEPPPDSFDDFDDDDALIVVDPGTEMPEEQLTDDVKVARDVLQELLRLMGLHVHVSVRRVETTREGENTPWLLNVVGPDLNTLVGRRGETLASLQYITRLISSRKLTHRANIVVDVDNYKARRSELLRGLANRMADQAVTQKRTVSLEPMPPHERRIVHMTLRERDDVTTRSIGEGDGRKVTIVPK